MGMYGKLPILKNHAEQNLSSMSDALVSVLARQIYTKNNFQMKRNTHVRLNLKVLLF